MESDVFVAVPAPTGRTSFEGVVVSTEEFSTVYADVPVLRMQLRVDTPEGSWFCLTRVPRSIMTEAHRQADIGGPRVWLVGRRVALTATLRPMKESHYAFGKRPSKGRIL